MNKQKIVIGIAVLSLLISAFAMSKSGVQGPAGRDGQNGIGSVTGPDSYFPFETHNGVGEGFNNLSFQQGTSTLCVSPIITATSTYSLTVLPKSATSTSVLVVVENRSNPYAPILSAATSTTNYVTSYNIPANSTNIIATSTALDAVNANTSINGLLMPNTYLVVYAKNGGNGSIAQSFGSGSVFASGGKCVLRTRSAI